MINALLTIGFGAIATAIGFGLSTRSRDPEGNDAWDRAGALVKISGALVVLFGCALLIQPSRNPMPNTIVLSNTMSTGSALHLRLPQPSVATNVSEKLDALRDAP
jgi:hypothetical protein